MQLQVNELGEFGGAQVTGVGLLAGMQSQMGLEVRGRAEPLLADLALVRLFTCARVHVRIRIPRSPAPRAS